MRFGSQEVVLKLNRLLTLSAEEPQVSLQPSTWVKLLDLPGPFSFDEALLLCEYPEGQWLAWVPDFGEILLSPGQFCPLR